MFAPSGIPGMRHAGVPPSANANATTAKENTRITAMRRIMIGLLICFIPRGYDYCIIIRPISQHTRMGVWGSEVAS